VSVDCTESIVDAFCNVVVVTVYCPVHACLASRNGNVTELEVPDLIVKAGVVNITVLEWLQLRPKGPESVN
jgi:hypothetical protein